MSLEDGAQLANVSARLPVYISNSIGPGAIAFFRSVVASGSWLLNTFEIFESLVWRFKLALSDNAIKCISACTVTLFTRKFFLYES